jgi:hypothetical protein
MPGSFKNLAPAPQESEEDILNEALQSLIEDRDIRQELSELLPLAPNHVREISDRTLHALTSAMRFHQNDDGVMQDGLGVLLALLSDEQAFPPTSATVFASSFFQVLLPRLASPHLATPHQSRPFGIRGWD